MSDVLSGSLILSRAVLVLLSVSIIVRCLRSLLSERYEAEIWAYAQFGNAQLPITHWENLIGRSPSADIRIDREHVGRVHAVLVRGDKGWTVFDVFSRGGVTVNGAKISPLGATVRSGDVIGIAGSALQFRDVSAQKRQKLEEKRTVAGKRISPFLTLFELSVFQIFLLLQHALGSQEHLVGVALGFAALLALEWFCYASMRLLGRSGFEIETIAFYLSSLGMSVAASAVPESLFKQIILLAAGVLLFLLTGWWLRSLKRITAVRVPVAAAALLLLAVNVIFSEEVMGARNWLEFGGYSFQPSDRQLILTAEVTADRNPVSDVNPGRDTKDKIFLLSIDEANRYFDSDRARQCRATESCSAVKMEKDDDGFCYWWLRSPGLEPSCPAVVIARGSVFTNGFSCGHKPEVAVRPAMWIELDGADR